MRKLILHQIDEIERKHCRSCDQMKESSYGRQMERIYRTVCSNCPFGQRISELGEMLSQSNVTPHWWNKEESFYAINHIEVLGLERGIRQVARRLGLKESQVECFYFDKTEKAYHTTKAV
ncbi:zinc-finger domain-containing protein [Bacillus suaedae]|uniref:Zinc-finger domain-containing protein n=1 Tax=Halalkalibacter suaedae TaxID=2822140 RepID=A0A940WVM0_9BACI|nr:zinc-finger domain-containing protein [Bacillus suaedae]MBP3951153.1 zinc-finger domain-containing protein [Bacillus suaedae]